MRRRGEVVAIAVLALLPFLFFWPVIFGGATLVPADNLYQWQPWLSLAEQLGVGTPHNELLSDLVLENYAWKLFIRQCIADGELPLWNPYLFTGVPFLAAGQHSALYPFSLLFYVLTPERAYGLFSALQLALAGIGAYALSRVIGANRAAAFVAGVAYSFSSFMVVSVAFTMVIAAAAWLPWCLWAAEGVILGRSWRSIGAAPAVAADSGADARGSDAERPGRGRVGVAYRPRDGLPWVVLGAVFLGTQVLAGHVEITYYVLLVLGYYCAVRLLQQWFRTRRAPWRRAVLLLSMACLGVGLGSIQLLPLYELVQTNFRSGVAAYEVTYDDVIGWAYPLRQLATFAVPDLFGNPSIHDYLDVLTLRWTAISHNALGEAIDQVAWGKGLSTWKNYVEGSAYVGVLPLIVVLPAVLSRRFRGQSLTLGALATVSLLFVFGTPLYRLIFLLPGVNQLHTPFRWVFPYTLSLAVMAGLGLTALTDPAEKAARGAGRWLAGVGVVGGGLGLLLLAAVLAHPTPFVSVADAVMRASEMAQRAFADGAMLLSYEWRNLLIFGAALVGSSVAVLAVVGGWRLGTRGPRIGPALAAAVLLADLFVIGYGFNPRADPALLQAEPGVVSFLRQDTEPWRLTTFISGGEKPLNANSAMLYGFEDIRGYDSIIPKQYVALMQALEDQDELLYNRIAPLSEAQSLDSPLLDLLNVKYVITSQELDQAGLELVYDGEVRAYLNQDYLPRAFAVTRARHVPSQELARALVTADPRQSVLLEGEPQAGDGDDGELLPVSILERGTSELLLFASLPEDAWVVLTDAYFTGWRAYVSPAGGGEEEQVEIERAYGAFRGVRLPAGQWQIRFKYMPRSFQVGLYVSFLSGIALLLSLAYWLWTRFYSPRADERTVQRVAKNSITPMALSLVNKLIDMALAMLMLRILAPEGAGRYQFAVTFIGYFEILMRFGLGTLVTREVARDPESGRHYLGNVLSLRGLLWVASLPIMSLVLLAYVLWSGLTGDVVVAVAFFAVAVFLSNVADAFSAIFCAHERMEQPAFVSTATTLVRVTLSAVVLLVGRGFVGLAAVSVLSNLFTVVALGAMLRRDYFRPQVLFDKGFARNMLSVSFPFMINHLLATVFFQVDVLLLQPMRGDVEVGYYSAAYRFIRGLDIIPSYFTMALFPVMSRYAISARDSLQRAYLLSLRLLFAVSLPIAVGTTFVARELILILAGSEFLNGSEVALSILIWYMPLGFVNSVTQYVLIALDEQRYLTRAFVIGVCFNLVANLITIPSYGYQGAAAVTVVSELVLLVPFMSRVYRHLDRVPWFSLVWRPAVASGAMALVFVAAHMGGMAPLLALPVAALVYAAALLVLGFARCPDVDMVIGLFRVRLGRRGAAPCDT